MSVDALEAAIDARQGKRVGSERRFLCPAHDDHRPSARWNPEKQVWHCDVCGAGGGWKNLAELLGVELPRQMRNGHRGGGGSSISPKEPASPQTSVGLTLEQYAQAKRLPVGELRAWGLSDFYYLGQPAVRIPYQAVDGSELAVQFRLSLTKAEDGADNRFRFKSDSKLQLYGINRLTSARKTGYAVLVEGASDCHTAWHFGIPALGLPGAGNWSEDRDLHHFDGIDKILLVREPDQGGEAADKWVAKSAIRDRLWLVLLGEHKDISGLYLADPEHFVENWSAARERAIPWSEYARQRRRDDRAAVWPSCASLALESRILDSFAKVLPASGLVGEDRAAKLVFLIILSRLLNQPVSAVLKGPSSAGKSYVVDRVLSFFPPEAYYALSAMSERALAYSDEPLAHRVLVIYEATGLQGDFASYLVRSLLSEGKVRYETVEKTKDGLRSRLVEREGPTGLLVTTTAVKLHPENETRVISIPVTDTQEQTKNVLKRLAEGDEGAHPDMCRWIALQIWLATGDNRVVIPYGSELAEAVPPVAVRLRRDFKAVLGLIRSHALLHQATRDRDTDGRIVACLCDYGVVRKLLADLLSEGVGATVSPTVRETVEAVRTLTSGDDDDTTNSAVARELKLDISAAYRRVQRALVAGYLNNLENQRRRPARLVLGEPMPDDQELLPALEGLQVCTHSAEETPPPSPSPAPPQGSVEQAVHPVSPGDRREAERARLCKDCRRMTFSRSGRCEDCRDAWAGKQLGNLKPSSVAAPDAEREVGAL